jgi:hypothetical protein
MTPDPSHPGGAALSLYQGYRYTIVTIIIGAQPHTEEAELWRQRETDTPLPRWTYFRPYVAATGAEAARRVAADFTLWVDGRLEAGGSGE